MRGEIISLIVAVCWTSGSLFAEVASKRLGSLVMNFIRMVMCVALLCILMLVFTSHPYPIGADAATWELFLLSGFIGYVVGDYCLFRSYAIIGSRYGQLLMTLAPPTAAVAGWIILHQAMTPMSFVAMAVTLTGIAIPLVPYRKEDRRVPLNGIVYGIIAGICQGIGLVISAKGISCYESSLVKKGYDLWSLRYVIPFSATFIRSTIALLAFAVLLFTRHHAGELVSSLRDTKGVLSVFGTTALGPFLGASLSIMATLYTSVGVAQTIMAIVPVLIILPTWLFFHQKVRIREIVGAVVAVAGVSLFFVGA